MTDKRLVLTSCGSLEEARSIALALVERQLAACVNIVPQIESVYRWQGEVETATEWLLLIKTTAAAFSGLREALIDIRHGAGGKQTAKNRHRKDAQIIHGRQRES